MCSSISWQQFIVTISVIVGLYYLYVGLSYYRKDWLYRLKAKKAPRSATPPVAFPVPVATVSPEPNPLLPVVHDLVDEIRALLQGIGEGINKVSILEKLKGLLQKYPTLKDSPFQPSINQLLAAESKNQCSVELDEEELDGLWS